MPGITVAAARTRPRRATESAAAQQRSHLGGCILWLPERNGRAVTPDYDGGDHDNGSGTLTAGCYNHPVVIISAGARRGKVTILILTSFNGTDLSERHPNDIKVRIKYLPIRPCRPHPDHGKLLELEDPSLRLRKNSYVNTANRHTVPYQQLDPYERSGTVYALSRASFHELVEYAQCHVPLSDVPGAFGSGVAVSPSHHPPSSPLPPLYGSGAHSHTTPSQSTQSQISSYANAASASAAAIASRPYEQRAPFHGTTRSTPSLITGTPRYPVAGAGTPSNSSGSPIYNGTTVTGGHRVYQYTGAGAAERQALLPSYSSAGGRSGGNSSRPRYQPYGGASPYYTNADGGADAGGSSNWGPCKLFLVSVFWLSIFGLVTYRVYKYRGDSVVNIIKKADPDRFYHMLVGP